MSQREVSIRRKLTSRVTWTSGLSACMECADVGEPNSDEQSAELGTIKMRFRRGSFKGIPGGEHGESPRTRLSVPVRWPVHRRRNDVVETSQCHLTQVSTTMDGLFESRPSAFVWWTRSALCLVSCSSILQKFAWNSCRLLATQSWMEARCEMW